MVFISLKKVALLSSPFGVCVWTQLCIFTDTRAHTATYPPLRGSRSKSPGDSSAIIGGRRSGQDKSIRTTTWEEISKLEPSSPLGRCWVV